jgi:DMSO/TMAO reductase YedYZ molybdopterin-dependent catalytic subunit
MKERLPPGQVLTAKWPVLHNGDVPRFDPRRWDFRVFGLVDRPLQYTYEELRRLPARDVRCDIHCVTTWSRFDNTFTGVPFPWIAEQAGVRPEARHVLAHCEQGFTANLRLEDLMRDDVLLAWGHDGQDLTPEHGFPLRLLVPHLYFWKSAKWLRGIELLRQDVRGFWERNGYHNRADPWRDQRYSWQEEPVDFEETE